MSDRQDDVWIAALPHVLAEYARATSVRQALELAAMVGGTRQYMPDDPSRDTQLVRAAGREAAATLLRLFGHGHLLIPLGPISAAANRGTEI